MPAQRLIHDVVELREFDLVGQDGNTPFIRHVGLAAEAGTARRDRVSVHQMGPPLQSPGEMKADVVGSAELTADESRKVQSFVDRHAGEHAARKVGKRESYCIVPHEQPVAEPDGTYSHTRFSCVGFAIEAFRYARLMPLNLDGIPTLDLDAVCQAYPDAANVLRNHPNARNDMGLVGGGPWPVILCGYLLHALNRPPRDIRTSKYLPERADAAFL